MTSLSNLAYHNEVNSNGNNQNHSSSGSSSNINNRIAPPPLPPRALQPNEAGSPPGYASVMAMSSRDLRSSSTQSLIPDPTLENTGRRRILLVYIHGFMGDETSFRSFPAHIHNLTSVTLAETHVVHTKIYPRYRARYSLEQARDQFSEWLAPHEDQWTDIVLLGHSMGGLLAADVALLFRHSIIGVVNFDVPFLGMHPGIIKAGLGSIFAKVPPPQDQIFTSPSIGNNPSRMSTIFNPKPSDPNYNPSFFNDVHLPVRKGWENALHWLNKHSNGIREAGKGLVKSHFEFGSAMADYKELKERYARVRALEEDDETKRKISNPNVRSPPRIRFVNYYTTSTGRPKKYKSSKNPSSPRPGSLSLQHLDSNSSGLVSEPEQNLRQQSLATPTPPRLSIDVRECRQNELIPVTPQDILSATSPQNYSSVHDDASSLEQLYLPEIPPIPQEPPFVDLMQIADRSRRRIAEREHNEALEEYHKAVKDRNRIINEREDIKEGWERQRQQAITVQLPNPSLNSSAKLSGEELRLEKEQERVAKEKARLEGMEYHPLREDSTVRIQERTDLESPNLESGLHAMQLGEKPSHSPYLKYDFSRSAILSQPSPDDQVSVTDSNYTSHTGDTEADSTDTKEEEKKQTEKKLGKFCMLPPKDSSGHKDPTWVRVHMEGMDEVAAHTSLFFVNETYEKLVGDVGARIEEWVREADSVRLVREMSGLE